MARVLVQEGAALDVFELDVFELDIFEAAAIGDAERVREVLNADAALLNAVSPDGFSPLELAAFFGQRKVAALLL